MTTEITARGHEHIAFGRIFRGACARHPESVAGKSKTSQRRPRDTGLPVSSGATRKAAKDLTAGDHVLIRFQVDAQGQWSAVGIDYQADVQEADNVECEDGLTPEGLECDGGPAANANDGSADDGEEADGDAVECEDGLTPDGVECDGGPAANADDGLEGEGEQDPAATGESQMIVLPLGAQPGSLVEAYGLRIQLPAQMVMSEPGNYRFTGHYLGGSQFAATQVQLSTSATPRVVGRIQAVTRRADGRLVIRLLDQTIVTHPLLRVSTKRSLDQEAELDNDGDTENGDA